MQDYFTSILRYAYPNDISINLDEAKALLKKARSLSKERGYNVFNVTKKGATGVTDNDSLRELSEYIAPKDLRDLKKLLSTIFHSDILEAVFNAEEA